MDELGASYLLVLSELDAKRIEPLGRVDRQLAVSEEQLVGEVRSAASELLGGSPGAAVPAGEPFKGGARPAAGTPPDEPGSPALRLAVAGAKIGGGGFTNLCGLLGCLFGAIAVSDLEGVPATDDEVRGGVILMVAGATCCAVGSGLCAWGIADLFPATEERDAQAATPPPPRAGAVAMPY